MRDRRQFIGAVALLGLAATAGVKRAKYTVRQLIAACRLWLRNHHVKGYATVTIIPGGGPPHPIYLEPGDGWRWAPGLSSFVGPALSVSWLAGDQIPSFASPIDGQHVQLYVGDWLVGGEPALADPEYAAGAGAYGVMSSDGPSDGSGQRSASRDGSGIAFVIQRPVLHGSAVNYATNPSAEVDASGWAGINSATVASSTDWSQSGSKSFKLTPSTGFADPTSGAVASSSGTALYVGTSTPTVSTHTFSVYARTTSPGSIEARLSVVWYSGASAGGTASGSYTAIGSDASRITLTATPPSIADHVEISLQIRSASPFPNLTSADVVYFDGVMVNTGDHPEDYFDGSTTDDTTYDYAWTGTPNASASTRAPVSAATSHPSSPDSPEMDALSLLGAVVSVDATFTYPPADVDGVGDDGDYYLDTSGKALYGPKNGTWPEDPAVEGFNLTRLVR